MRALALLSTFIMTAVTGCFLAIGVGDYETGTTGGTGTGGSSSGSETTTSGAGGGIPCMSAKDCPGQDAACRVRTCEDSICLIKNLPKGTAVTPDPSPGDCSSVACDGKGGIIAVPDATDTPKTADKCLRGTCDKGKPKFVNQPAGTQCGNSFATMCDPNGICTNCTTDQDCGKGDACFTYQCITGNCDKLPTTSVCGAPPSCTDGVEVLQNVCMNDVCTTTGTQACTPYACNGNTCGVNCNTDQDCEAGLTCSNHSCSSQLPNGAACTNPSDCANGNCVDGFCCNMACIGPCMGCSAAKKGSGIDGNCGALPVGTTCGLTTCSAEVISTETRQACDATGDCSSLEMGCGKYVCNGNQCGTTCQSNLDCTPYFECSGTTCCASCAALSMGSTVGDLCPGASTNDASSLNGCGCKPGFCDTACSTFCAGGTINTTCATCLTMNCGNLYNSCNDET